MSRLAFFATCRHLYCYASIRGRPCHFLHRGGVERGGGDAVLSRSDDGPYSLTSTIFYGKTPQLGAPICLLCIHTYGCVISRHLCVLEIPSCSVLIWLLAFKLYAAVHPLSALHIPKVTPGHSPWNSSQYSWYSQSIVFHQGWTCPEAL